MEINNNNYFLPEEISIDILSRLPTDSVIRCSLVRKSWRNLILYNRDFARMHLLRGLESHDGSSAYHGRINFLLLNKYSAYHKKRNTLYYTLDDDNYEKATPVFRALDSIPNSYNKKNYYVVGSCNGLICMAYANVYYDRDFEQPMYICNPITREWLTLPSLTINDCCSSCSTNDNNDPIPVSNILRVVCGFGYLPSTDEYKVVRITYCRHRGCRAGRVQVYTLGDGTVWRDKGKTTNYKLIFFRGRPSILANGALHWLDYEHEGMIVAFDLADEEFLILPPPPCLEEYNEYYKYYIQVLGGQLCAFYSNDDLTSVDVWFYKNTKKEKNGNYKDNFWSWSKGYDIEWDLMAGHHLNPYFLAYKQGDVLYWNRKRLFCYEYETATSKELVDMAQYLSDFFGLVESIVPHLNSFISLKALGEEHTEIISSRKKEKKLRKKQKIQK